MMATAADEHPARSGRLLFSVPETDVHAWLMALDAITPEAHAELQRAHGTTLPHALVSAWLGELLDIPAAAVTLTTAPGGKPSLAGHALAFNISHSRRWLALAWSRSLPTVGVDIEDLGRGQSFAALAARYFHPQEIASWEQAPADTREQQWLRVWTRKEAVLKAHGLGLRLRLNGLNTISNPVRHPELGCWAVHSAQLAGGHPAVLSLSWPG